MTFIEELLSAWSQADRQDIRQSMGYPSVSPSFKHLGSSDDSDELFELSREDIQRVSTAVASLPPDEYQAVCRRFRPWAAGSPRPDDDYLLQMAYTRLQKVFTGST